MPRKVEDFSVGDGPSLDALVRRMEGAGGFSSQQLVRGVDLLAQMLRDPDLTLFLSFPADIVATGTRGLLRELIAGGYVDAVITTCGTIDHDLARTDRAYHHGEWELDDAALRRQGKYRLGNLVIPEANYGPVVERRVSRLLERRWKTGQRSISARELVWELGKDLGEKQGAASLCRAALEQQVPFIVPGLLDGAVGSQLWFFWQRHKEFRLDLFSDEAALSDLVFGARRAGALMLGGGISKHHTIWWSQFRGGLDAAVYVTTAVEWDGSLSGARTREAISWGKVKPKAGHVTIAGDVTVVLPVLLGAALERLR
ncbi:MAG: deoxyhypusine synthase [Thermoplasmata archaeon]|nr:deoxyhypusine synthase [Thermoplasmata archaeon]MCI4341142.1 deoxyhypusine synthase [Thermoplasmata archaeon]